MGKADSSSDQPPANKLHFSHPHALTLIDLDHPHHRHQHHPPAPPSHLSCAGCKLGPSGSIYACTAACNSTYFLHKKCFDMPKKITHPCHVGCRFSLLAEPAYPNGLFRCDACHETSGGFSYHCEPCGVDLHILCAAMPLTTAYGGHKHELKLAFECPYPTKDFSCDVCGCPGSNHWLYRCAPCGFDAHLKCARSKAPPPVAAPPPPLAPPQFVPHHGHQPQASHHQFHGGPPPPPVMMNNQFVHPYNAPPPAAVGVPAGINSNPMSIQNNQAMMFLQAFQQKMQNDQAFHHAMLARGFGGGGGAALSGGGGVRNNMGLPELMRMMNGFGGIGGGGGLSGVMSGFGGGGFDQLQPLFGGGGLDFLGGGGLDFLGGGGLDFLGGGGLDMIGGFLG